MTTARGYLYPGELSRRVAAALERPLVVKRRRQEETNLQAQIVATLRVFEAQGRLWWAAIPNGLLLAGTPAERARRGAILKRRGMLKPGAFDLIVLVGGASYGLELKRPKRRDAAGKVVDSGGRLAETQRDEAERFGRAGGRAERIDTYEQFRAFLARVGIKT